MLTGEITISSGDAFIYGRSIRYNMEAIRQSIGFCPQHNILWPSLTPREHLRVYAVIKGVEESKVDAAVDEMLEKVHMKEHEVRTQS